MTPEARRELASRGGKAAHAAGTAHQFTREEAVEAGRKGGKAVASRKGHMAAIGKLGGEAPHPPPAKREAAEGEDASLDLGAE